MTKSKDFLKYRLTKATKKEIKKADEDIIKYNTRKLNYPVSPPWSGLHYVIKDNTNIVVASVTSYLMMDNVLNISVLFVEAKYRGNGYGSKLLAKVESKAKEKGVYMVILDTFSFQGSLEFYKRHGYEVFSVLENYPTRNHKQYYMKKNLIF